MPDGIDPEAVTRYFTANLAGVTPPLTFTRIAGGRSNLTYTVTDAAGAEWVLRRPPLGERLGSAHDMVREHTIMAALAPTAVPVPKTLALCEDEQVTGAPFYVMDRVNAAVLRDVEAARAFGNDALRRTAGEAVVDTLVDLHAVDPDAVGLGELGRRDGYCERQLRRWARQWEASKTRELPAMDETHALLSERIPPQQGVAIVHGDYRLDNVMLAPDATVAAVLDWELCTLGDPLADVGLLWVYWGAPDDPVQALGEPPTGVAGFPSREEALARYAEKSGRDVGAIDFYVALASWKLAAILEGVYARYASGAYGGAADDFESFKTTVERLADAALAAARRL